MDVQMPEMDGFEATSLIRNGEAQTLNPMIPIIAMTAHAMRGDKEKCIAAGMSDYIPKPITPQSLTQVITHWLLVENPASKKATPSNEKPLHPIPACSSQQSKNDNDSPQAPAPVVFDQKAFMDRVMDDAELACTILSSFVEDMPKHLVKLKEHASSGDYKTIERLAHRIKGSAASVGGCSFSQAALSLEKSAAAQKFQNNRRSCGRNG